MQQHILAQVRGPVRRHLASSGSDAWQVTQRPLRLTAAAGQKEAGQGGAPLCAGECHAAAARQTDALRP